MACMMPWLVYIRHWLALCVLHYILTSMEILITLALSIDSSCYRCLVSLFNPAC